MFGYNGMSNWDMNDSFSISEALDVFGSNTKPSKKEKLLDKMLKSKSFYGYIYVGNHEEKREKIKTLYKYLEEYDNIRAIYNVVTDGMERYPRTAGAFLYTVCSCVTMDCNAVESQVRQDLKAGRITSSERDDILDEIDKCFAYAKKINDYIIDAVKPYAKKLSNKTGIPKDVCIHIVKNIPEKAYITKDDIGNYLNIITDIIYSEMDEYDVYNNSIDWDVFFSKILGNDFIKDIAMYLTVEGASRIKKTWKNEDTVQAIWDDLTRYALNTLEDMPENDRDHMLGLYRKLISTMSGDKRNDLRIDLTTIDKDIFPKLAASVEKCWKKIKDAVNIAKDKASKKKDETIETVN
jgi:hypothetical protein